MVLLGICQLLGTACRTEKKEVAYETRIHTYDELITHFSNPGAEFRPAPLWVWHGDITREVVDVNLREFKDKGFGGFFIHPRYGLITQYMSDDWYDMVAYTLEVAEQLGLYVWLYDENSYPSGFAGGLVPHHMPDSYKHGQALRIHKMDVLEMDPEIRYKHVFEVMSDGQMMEITAPANRAGESGAFILYEIVHYQASKWTAGYPYVDLLYPGVTEMFMDVALSGYKERFGEHFGNLIPGIFTDEPNINPPGGHTAVRWTPDLYDVFEERWGYKLQDNLLSLFEPTADWKRVRHNYYQTLLEMFIDRWAKPWFEYTEEHQLKWTGHYWEHGWPNPTHGADNMAMYAWKQVPGIDLLFNTMYTDERHWQFGNTRNVKEARSAANQTGRTRVLSETYGGSGWQMTFEDMKRLGDWMYVLGINFMNQHMTHTTLLGDRKQDYPQSFSYHSPWWDHYELQNDYFSRLSVALSAGRQNNTMLVIEPTSSTWMYFSSYSNEPFLGEIANEFHDLLDQLEQYKIAYDVGSENMIKDIGRIENTQFVVGEAMYNLVVLPFGTENLDSPTVDLLEQYLENGGRVISLRTIPDRIDGKESDEIVRLMNRFDEHWSHYPRFTVQDIPSLFHNETIRFSESAMTSRWFLHHVRELNDGKLVFLVNSSPDEMMEGYFDMDGNMVVRLDPFTGEQTQWPHTTNGEQLRAEFSVHPAGSLMLFISENEVSVPPDAEKPDVVIVAETTESIVNAVLPNMLTLDYGELFLDEQSRGHMYYYRAGDLVWQHHGYPDNPWASGIQFKTELVDADTFATDSGFEFVYSVELEERVDMSSIQAVSERPDIFQLSINDIQLNAVEDQWFIDRDFAVYEIGEYLNPGTNDIRVTVNPMSMFAELQPVYILGNFSLENAASGWNIVPHEPLSIGSWKASGYPFYYDQVVYSKRATFGRTPDRAVVQLGEWAGTVAEVLVNHQSAGIIQQPPYQLDITDWLVAGQNSVEVSVYGSKKNLMGPHHQHYTGFIRPSNFRYGPETQPSGEQYHLLDYGLFEDFQILITEP